MQTRHATHSCSSLASLKCKEAILSMLRPTQTLMDRPKTCQDKHKIFMNLSLKHAQIRANNLRHVKAFTRHYMATMLSMHKGPKPT